MTNFTNSHWVDISERTKPVDIPTFSSPIIALAPGKILKIYKKVEDTEIPWEYQMEVLYYSKEGTFVINYEHCDFYKSLSFPQGMPFQKGEIIGIQRHYDYEAGTLFLIKSPCAGLVKKIVKHKKSKLSLIQISRISQFDKGLVEASLITVYNVKIPLISAGNLVMFDDPIAFGYNPLELEDKD